MSIKIDTVMYVDKWQQRHRQKLTENVLIIRGGRNKSAGDCGLWKC